jgi:hypothetical protein
MYGISRQNRQTAGYLNAGSSLLGAATQFAANKYQRKALTLK